MRDNNKTVTKHNGNGTDHVITVESTQVWRADVTPEIAEYLTGEGTRRNIYGREYNRQDVELNFHEETKRTFECSCGKRFRKGETARDHLEQFLPDENDD